tara:strand:- start:778 stop:1023 length:246 start_codon:yes stop_codon:yes gene_type:complete
LREIHSEWQSEVSDSEICTDVGLAVEIQDDEDMLYQYEEELESNQKMESIKKKKGWSGVKDILTASRTSKLFSNNKVAKVF